MATKSKLRKKIAKKVTRKVLTHNYEFFITTDNGTMCRYFAYNQVDEDAARAYVIETHIKNMRHNGLRGPRKKIQFISKRVNKNV